MFKPYNIINQTSTPLTAMNMLCTKGQLLIVLNSFCRNFCRKYVIEDWGDKKLKHTHRKSLLRYKWLVERLRVNCCYSLMTQLDCMTLEYQIPMTGARQKNNNVYDFSNITCIVDYDSSNRKAYPVCRHM